MERNIRKSSWAVLRAVPALVAMAGAAQAGVQDCRNLIGIDSAVNPPVLATAPTAWTIVDDNSASFLSKRTVDSCAVKVVVTAAKGKPTTTTLTVAGPLTQDECSMYLTLSSIDSKLVQGKIADADSTALNMVAKIDSLGSNAQLIDPGYSAIRNAAAGIQACIAALY